MTISLDSGATPDTDFASDAIGGVHHPYVKVEFGPNGTATPVSPTNPLPVLEPKKNAAPQFRFEVTDASDQVLAADGARVLLAVFNDSDSVIYLSFGETAQVGYGARIPPEGSFSLEGITTTVHAIHDVPGESKFICGFTA